MEGPYPGVSVNTLIDAERRVPTGETETPLVITPKTSAGKEFLREFLSGNSTRIINDIAKHGALLIRGFAIESNADFEEQVLSIRGMRGMREILLSEAGRTIQDGARFVFHTNSIVKTGGSFSFGMFHHENYFLPDVPRYITFFCTQPPSVGGETGLVNTAKLYADLPEAIRRKLEDRACLVSLYPITEVTRRYAINSELVLKFCSETGLPVANVKGAPYIAIYKPSVIQHPITSEKALSVNFTQIEGLSSPVRRAFMGDYSGLEWLLHKIIWGAPALERIYERVTFRSIIKKTKESGELYVGLEMSPFLEDSIALSSIFAPGDPELLGDIVRRRYASFAWKRGDILIIDNLKMAHNGMPGYGKRKLGALLCNTVRLPSSRKGAGLHCISASDQAEETLGAQLLRFREMAHS